MKRIVVPVLIAGAIAAGFYAGRISSACAGKEEDRPKASAESSGGAAKLAKAERRIAELERKLARELGYAGEDVESLQEAVGNIFDCTAGGLDGMMDAAEGVPGVEIGTDVQLLTL